MASEYMQVMAVKRTLDATLEAARFARDAEVRQGDHANQAKCRALALVVTKLEEAELWLTKAL